jgi:hypothetical protein
MMKDVCLSGGALGADLQWGMCAGMAGHTVIHWSFKGHRTTAPKQELVVLNAEQLLAADEALKAAAPKLLKGYRVGRPPDRNDSFVANLLRRNFYQVATAERVYAVTSIKDGIVQGGTAWATQMFMDRFNGDPCECYVFDQVADGWFKWNGLWEAISSPPEPFGVWAGIGSRDLQQNGKAAIRALLGYTGNPVQKLGDE